MKSDNFTHKGPDLTFVIKLQLENTYLNIFLPVPLVAQDDLHARLFVFPPFYSFTSATTLQKGDAKNSYVEDDSIPIKKDRANSQSVSGIQNAISFAEKGAIIVELAKVGDQMGNLRRILQCLLRNELYGDE